VATALEGLSLDKKDSRPSLSRVPPRTLAGCATALHADVKKAHHRRARQCFLTHHPVQRDRETSGRMNHNLLVPGTFDPNHAISALKTRKCPLVLKRNTGPEVAFMDNPNPNQFQGMEPRRRHVRSAISPKPVTASRARFGRIPPAASSSNRLAGTTHGGHYEVTFTWALPGASRHRPYRQVGRRACMRLSLS